MGEKNFSGLQWGPVSWPSAPVICVSCLSTAGVSQLHGSPNVLDRFPPNCSICTAGHNIIVINLAIIEFCKVTAVFDFGRKLDSLSSSPVSQLELQCRHYTSGNQSQPDRKSVWVCGVCVCVWGSGRTVMDSARRGRKKSPYAKLIQWSFRNCQEIRWIKLILLRDCQVISINWFRKRHAYITLDLFPTVYLR